MDSIHIQTMDLTTLKAVISDIRELIVPSRFEKAIQTDQRTIQIGFRTLLGLTWIEISWDADLPRLTQIQKPSRSGGDSTLAKQIQHGLRNFALTEIKQEGFERVIELGFSSRPGEEIIKTIVFEMMGRHSNILLIGQQRKVITLGRQIRIHQSRIRPLSTGDIYVAPPPLKGIEPSSKESYARWKKRLLVVPTKLLKALQDTYQGVSPSLAIQLIHKDNESIRNLLEQPVQELSEDDWKQIHRKWLIWIKSIENNSFSLSFDGPTPYNCWYLYNKKYSHCESLSLILGDYYKNLILLKKISHTSKEIQSMLDKVKKSEKKALLGQEQLLEKSKGSSLLKVEADNYLCIQPPRKEHIEKAQQLYKLSKKLKRSKGIISQRIKHHQEKLNIIEESEEFISNLLLSDIKDKESRYNSILELKEDIELHLSSTKRNRKSSTVQKNAQPTPLEINSPNGLIIQIGRNHRQNELISLKQGRNGDLWFHAQECPGSHVVLKSSEAFASDEDIQVSAHLAALFSKAKGNQRVPVINVPLKQLRRISGAIKGAVSHRGGKIYWGEPLKGRHYLESKELI